MLTLRTRTSPVGTPSIGWQAWNLILFVLSMVSCCQRLLIIKGCILSKGYILSKVMPGSQAGVHLGVDLDLAIEGVLHGSHPGHFFF